MSGAKLSDVHEIYNLFIQVIFGDRSFKEISPYISPHLSLYGTAEHERILGIDAFQQLIEKQNLEISGLTMKYNPVSTIADTQFANGSGYLIVQEILIQFVEIKHSMLFRLSTIWTQQEEHWLLFHGHSSTPDQNISDREAWPIEGVMKKNKELEENIAIKTAELRRSLESLKAAQDQLIHSEKMASLGELTAGIAHEIQNPLNFVNNFSEVSAELVEEIEEEIENNDLATVKELLNELIQNLQKIHHHGERASGIVRGMLDHSRTNSNEKTLSDINQMCDEYLRLAYHGLRAKNKSFQADFKLEVDPALPEVSIASQDIGRVLLNLINNGFQAILEKSLREDESYKPTLVVSTKKNQDSLEISIADNGPGIPDDIKNKIFQPFFTTKPTGQGTGLGLSLAYDIIKAHRGKINVNSTEVEGTIFTIILPIDRITRSLPLTKDYE